MKEHIIRLTEEESDIRDETMDKLAGGSQKKVRRASVLRNVDVYEPGLTNPQVAEANHCECPGAPMPA